MHDGNSLNYRNTYKASFSLFPFPFSIHYHNYHYCCHCYLYFCSQLNFSGYIVHGKNKAKHNYQFKIDIIFSPLEPKWHRIQFVKKCSFLRICKSGYFWRCLDITTVALYIAHSDSDLYALTKTPVYFGVWRLHWSRNNNSPIFLSNTLVCNILGSVSREMWPRSQAIICITSRQPIYG